MDALVATPELYTTLENFPLIKEGVSLIPYAIAKKYQVMPVEKLEGAIKLAMLDTEDLASLQALRSLLGVSLIALSATKAALEGAMEACYHKADQIVLSEQEAITPDAEEAFDLTEQNLESPLIELLNAILLEAILQGASDIHFDPGEPKMSVRYRIDGTLVERHAPLKQYQAQIITRIKVMAKLDIAEQRLPQDGRIKLKAGARQVDFRVSTIPVLGGERVVLRILDKGKINLGIEFLGMEAQLQKQFERFLGQSEGIILVTGPTGSGKTTTLYSALIELESAELNIMTVEDPVEYKLPGMAQIAVNPKIHLTFATGLRHILRQDPDIVMVGEIRDAETAQIAIQASLTGHLVLSTLHTNDAPSALTRLVDMGIEPYLLSSSVLCVLAQRLLRVICPHCKVGYMPSQEELQELEVDQSVSYLYYGAGCDHCLGTGYKGRRAIYELMPLGAEVKKQVMRSLDASVLKQIAIEEGMKTLRFHASQLALEGCTTLQEVLRVTRSME